MKGTFAKDKIYIFFLCLVAFAIPFPFIYSSISIILLLIVWIITTDFKKTLYLFLKNKYLWFWCLLFLLTAISYIYSFDKTLSINDLQRKLSFIILPIIIGTQLKIDKNVLKKIFTCFVSGLLIVIMFCIVNAIIRWQHTKDLDVFFYHNLVAGLNANAVYYALYIYFALVLILLYNWEGTFFQIKWVYSVALSLLLIFFILLSSKSLLLLFIILVFPVFLIRTLKKHKLISLIIIIVGFSTIGGIFFTQNPIHKRYQEILENNDKESWLPEYANGQKQHFNNLTLRRFLWSTAIENIKENNLWLYGCGNGGVLELQKQKIKKKIIEYGADNQLINTNPPLWDYNLHNMYLQTLMMLGIPGLFTFLVILIAPLIFIKFKEEKRIYYLFFISIIIFMFQESALQTQAGIVYSTYFYMVIYSYVQSTYRKENITII